MRDLIVAAIVFGALPIMLSRPYVGLIVWTWLSLMNPHKLSWGFAYHFPFAQLVAIFLLAGMFFSKEKKRIPWEATPTKLLAIWWAWMLITTLFALNPDGAWMQWDKVWKIQLLTFVTMILLTTPERIKWIVLTMTVSIGLYGVKGGIFTISTGGSYKVWGPAGTFIGGNNEIGLAMIMTLPLMRFFQLQAKRRWEGMAWLASMFFTFVAIIGTQSRGALVGVSVMGLYLMMKSRNKFGLLLVIILAVPAVISFMPTSWHERMGTIKTYDEDASAMGRIYAWRFAFNLAVERPLTGGGFETFRPWIYYNYVPGHFTYHDAHSIYFEVLGEQGFVGIGLFLALGFFSLKLARQNVRQAKHVTSLFWMVDLNAMIQVAIIGYAACGAFLGLAYFDYYYALIAVLVGSKVVLNQEQRKMQALAAEAKENNQRAIAQRTAHNLRKA